LTLAVLTTTILLTLGVSAALFFSIVRQFLTTCGPNQILIFTGRPEYLDAEGRSRSYGVLSRGGRRVRVPIIERVDRLDLRSIPVSVQTARGPAKCGTRVTLHAAAVVKVSSDPRQLDAAVERLLGKTQEEIGELAHGIILGALCEIIPKMSAAELREDRETFDQHLMQAAEDDFYRAGLTLDSLQLH